MTCSEVSQAERDFVSALQRVPWRSQGFRVYLQVFSSEYGNRLYRGYIGITVPCYLLVSTKNQ